MTHEDIVQRFKGVENSPAATDEQKEQVAVIRGAVLNLAIEIDAADLHPRYKATALTELETAGMFAVKGVFAPRG